MTDIPVRDACDFGIDTLVAVAALFGEKSEEFKLAKEGNAGKLADILKKASWPRTITLSIDDAIKVGEGGYDIVANEITQSKQIAELSKKVEAEWADKNSLHSLRSNRISRESLEAYDLDPPF